MAKTTKSNRAAGGTATIDNQKLDAVKAATFIKLPQA